ncbi:hypothetical protein [Nonomuraea sp. NPDC049480]|uniref:hypothetical protein n=1 Tax=Nonomuraea sp. NPDC049480 TaxID=3364353 RepID=UPI00378EA1E3
MLVFTAATNVRKRLLDYSGEELDRMVGLNPRASFDVVRAFGAGTVERGVGGGSIIGFASIRASVTEPGQRVCCCGPPPPSSGRTGWSTWPATRRAS